VIARFSSREDAESAYHSYLKSMADLGVKVSKEKTLLSDSLAEGVGRLVWKGSHIEPLTGQLSQREVEYCDDSSFTKAVRSTTDLGRALYARFYLKSLTLPSLTYRSRSKLSLDHVTTDLHCYSQSSLRTLHCKRRVSGLPTDTHMEIRSLKDLTADVDIVSPLKTLRGRIRPINRKEMEYRLIADAVFRLMIKDIPQSAWSKVDEPYSNRHVYTKIGKGCYYSPSTKRILKYEKGQALQLML
jgi:hypothetical protein